jgi:hypothetical protein
MTPDELQRCLDDIGWSSRGLSDRIGVAETTVRRWRSGQAETPLPIAHWLRQLAAAHRRLPPPAAPPRPATGRPPGGNIFGGAGTALRRPRAP